MAGFLARTGELHGDEGPAERATPQRVAAWRRENKTRGLAPTSRRQVLQNLGAMLRLLAPAHDWSFVIRPGNRSLKRAIRGGPKPVIVRDVADVMVHVRRLHRQGLAASDGPEKWQALRDAALLALLLIRAPRVGSLVPMMMGPAHRGPLGRLLAPPVPGRAHQEWPFARFSARR
jgi:hypothetical protein